MPRISPKKLIAVAEIPETTIKCLLVEKRILSKVIFMVPKWRIIPAKQCQIICLEFKLAPPFQSKFLRYKKVHSISGRFEKIEQYTFAFSKLSLNQRILVTCSKKRLPYHIISYLHNTIQKCSFFSSHYWCYCCHLSKLLRANGFCRLNESEIITHRQRHKVVAINVSYISIHTFVYTCMY